MLTVWVYNFLSKGNWRKSWLLNVVEIDRLTTYFASMARAKTPAASGAAAEVPE